MSQILGRATISVDGLQLDSAKGATLDLGGAKRNPVVTARGVAGFNEEQVPAMVECKVPVDDVLDLERLRNTKSATISFAGDAGKSYVVREAHLVDTIKLEDDKGMADLKFAGKAAEVIS